MEQKKIEQRSIIKLGVKLGESASFIIKKLKQAYGDQSLSRSQVFRWYKAFVNGREALEDEPRSGRPLTMKTFKNLERIRSLLNSDSRMSLTLISSELKIKRSSVYLILKEDLGLKRVCGKMMPKKLTVDQMDHRKNVCVDLLNEIDEDPDFFVNVITGDKMWVFECETVPDAPWQKASGQKTNYNQVMKTKFKCLLVCFFDHRGMVHEEYIPPDVNFDHRFYNEVLKRLKDKVDLIRPEISDTWMLHQTLFKKSTSIGRYLTQNEIMLILHPPYSPDLNPCDFFLFPKIKNHLAGRHFESVHDIQSSISKEINGIPVNSFRRCFIEWEQRLLRCYDAEGTYFEVGRRKRSNQKGSSSQPQP